MRILFISDRREGGIRRHVQCLRSCLPADVVSYAIGEDEAFAGKSGHDIREWFQIRRVIREFKPDVVHFHTIPLMMALYVRFVARLPRVVSIHTPSNRKVVFDRHMLNLAVMPCYFLPVSSFNWDGFRARYPRACGEVFFNPLRIQPSISGAPFRTPGSTPVVGMVGRNAAVKDWPAFHAVMEKVRRRIDGLEVWNIGENGFCPDAKEKIRRMDLFVMTSVSEEMPTTVLECFQAGTPICGFIPRGGMSDILSFSNGALRKVFIGERSVDKLAEIVLSVLRDKDLKVRLVEDGWQILTQHFDAEKNVRGRLVEVYERCRQLHRRI